MRSFITTILSLLCLAQFVVVTCDAKPAQLDLSGLTLSNLEQQQSEIESELKELARLTLRGGTGSTGYRGPKYTQPKVNLSIYIDLDDIHAIDQIVLVPSLWRDTKTVVRAEGFPEEFSITAGTDETSHLVANFTTQDGHTPRIAPLSVSFESIHASWVRIDITRLAPDIGNELHSLQLSEILVFDGLENIALQKDISVTDNQGKQRKRMTLQLTDGFTPYLMDAAQGARSQTQTIRVNKDPEDVTPTLTLDLQAPTLVNQINLHMANMAHSIPKSHFSCWGVPRHVLITGSNHSDFREANVLFEHEQFSIYDTGPIIMRRFPETLCRYIRINILDPNPIVAAGTERPQVAFTEVEVLYEGNNLAFKAPIIVNYRLSANTNTLDRMTDQHNYYGEILPIRTWINQLARRHQLEYELPLVTKELNRRYERQKSQLHLLAWAFALLCASTIVIILISKVLRQRAISHTRERIAANLHDELGANLHAIGLFSDLAKQEVTQAGADEKWSDLIRYVDEVRNLTERAGKTARYTTNMLEARELYENLPQEMQRTAERLLTDLTHVINFTNEECTNALSARRRIGLFLFYKECLTNIIRHSEATQVKTSLSADKKHICLTVIDNGLGLQSNTPPASLLRRARLLKARMSTEQIEGGGTKITLNLRA